MVEMPAAPEYERPRIERVLTLEELELEILYAGFDNSVDRP